MADISVAEIKEKRLYLEQIQYLEERLESCQLKREKLEKENKDLSSWYSVLERDKRDVTEHLKRSLAAKELEVDELQSQQQAIKHEGRALKLQHSKQMQVLQEQILELCSVSMKQATKFEEQEEELNKLLRQQLRQQLSGGEDEESLEKQLAIQRKEHDAAIENLEKEAQLERQIITKEIEDRVDNCVETEISIILQDEWDTHIECLEHTQFLQEDNETVQKELVDLRDRKNDLCIKSDDLKRDVSKISPERLTLVKELKELKKKVHPMKIKLKDCRVTQKNLLAKEESLRQDLALASEKGHLQTAKAFQLRAKVESERGRSRQLEKDMREAVIILRYVTKEIQKGCDTQWTMERLLVILECSFHQGAKSILDNSTERSSQGQKQHTSGPKPARKLFSHKTFNLPPLAAKQTNSEEALHLQTAKPKPINNKKR